MELHRYSMPRSAQGNFDQMKLLTAHLSLDAMLVRETVQNSWDARDPRRGKQPVEYILDGGWMRAERRDLLATLLKDRPTGGLPPSAAGDGQSLSRTLNQRRVPYLIVGDRNTVGLGGPHASNVPGDPSEARFARFLLDMGRPPGIEAEGGTYGYGKTVLWRASECATVLVFSRFRHGAGVRSRLMAAAMGDTYVEGGDPKTGRHWWGLHDETYNVVPVEGEDAKSIAHDLGLWDPNDTRTGTSVLVIGSRFHAPEHVERLREAIRFHCWPKWSKIDKSPEMAFSISCEGHDLQPLDSDRDPMIRPFVDAFKRVLDGKGTSCEVQRPAVVAGHFAIVPAPTSGVVSEVTEDDEDLRPINGPLNHIAWVRRGPRLHIKFEEFPTPPPEGMMRAGVFLTGPDQNGYRPEVAFAEAEPPTHDDWAFENVPKGNNKTIVKVGLRQLRSHIHATMAPVVVQSTSTESLGVLANHLGSMLDLGSGPSRPKRKGGGGGVRNELKVVERGSAIELHDGQRWAVLRLKVEGRRGRTIELSPSVRVVDADGGTTVITDSVNDRVAWTWDGYDEVMTPALRVEGGDPDDKIECWVPMDEPRLLRLSVAARLNDE